MGLSSIATLSLGLSMSMAGAGRAVIRSLGPGHRQALQQFFPVVPPPSAALMQLKEASEESAESKDTQCHLLDHPENHILCPVPWSRQTVLLSTLDHPEKDISCVLQAVIYLAIHIQVADDPRKDTQYHFVDHPENHILRPVH